MKELLLDTHTFLWWIAEEEKLSTRSTTFIKDPTNKIFLSVASVWEIMIKISTNKLQFPHHAEAFIAEQVQINDFQILPIEFSHTCKTKNLPLYHQDPFDRMLIAQAQSENLLFITNDQQIQRYEVQHTW